MSIQFVCNCGWRFEFPDSHAGKQVRCPGCDAVHHLSQPTDRDEPDPTVEEAPKPLRKQARRPRQDDVVGRLGGSWESDDGGGGLTFFGIHVTKGVLTGAGLLLLGLSAMVGLMLFPRQLMNRGTFAVFVGCTVVGGYILIRSLFYGEED